MKQSERIVKNAMAAGVGVAGSGVLQLVAFLYVAKNLSVEDFGTFSFLVAFSGIFQLVADFGLSNILVRELATQKDRARELLGAARSLTWIVSGAMLLVVAGLVFLLGFDPQLKKLAVIMGAGTLCLYHAAGYAALFRAFEDIEYTALVEFLHKILALGLLALALHAGTGLLGVILAHAVANALQWFCYYLLVAWKYFRPRLYFVPAEWRRLGLEALSLGGGSICRQLGWRVDILLLTALASVTAVGYFTGPYRIVIALNLIPMVVCMPLFAVFSRLAVESRAGFALAYRRTSKFLWLISVPLAIVLVVWAEPLIHLALGDKYGASIDPMRLLAVALIPSFLSAPLPFLFTALHEQKLFTVVALSGLGLRVALNCILVPMFGPLMACITVLVSESALLATYTLLLQHKGMPLPFDASTWKPLVAGLAVGAGLALFASASIPVMILVGAAAGVLYLLLVVALKTFTAEEIQVAGEGLSFIRRLRGKLPGKYPGPT